jgi:hypothetical protein
MKDQETQQRFILLRSQGWSFSRIAQELNVSKATLINWSRRFQFEINNSRAIELEALQEKLIANRETRAVALGQQLKLVEAELGKRDFTQVPTPRLFAIANSLRREILRETGSVQFTQPVTQIPGEEFHEEVQDWSA